MKQLRITSQVLAVLFAFGIAASSTGLAAEGLLPQQGEKGASGEGGEVVTSNLNKEELKCKDILVLNWRFLTGSNIHGSAEFHFTGCTVLGFAANTLGDASGVVLRRRLFLLCLRNPKTLVFGVLLQSEETVHIEVPALKALLLEKGAIIAENLSGNKGKEFTFAAQAGDPAVAECEIEGKIFKNSLELAVDTKSDVDASETITLKLKFGEEVELMDK